MGLTGLKSRCPRGCVLFFRLLRGSILSLSSFLGPLASLGPWPSSEFANMSQILLALHHSDLFLLDPHSTLKTFVIVLGPPGYPGQFHQMKECKLIISAKSYLACKVTYFHFSGLACGYFWEPLFYQSHCPVPLLAHIPASFIIIKFQFFYCF